MSQISQEKYLELYSQFRNRLSAASHKIVNDTQKAEDIFQEVFARLYKQDYSRIEDHVTEWLFIVCRNLSIKYYHSKNKIVLIDNIEAYDRPDDNLTASDQMMKNELIEAMLRHIKGIPKKHQDILKLRYFDNLSYEQIAKKMKTTSGNVGFLLSTTISKIRKKLERENTQKGYY